jgi:hypothetical protein
MERWLRQIIKYDELKKLGRQGLELIAEQSDKWIFKREVEPSTKVKQEKRPQN